MPRKRKVTLDTRGWDKLNRNLGKGSGILVGIQGSQAAAQYPDGTPGVVVAGVHEFGSPTNNIPERSFIRSTISEKGKGYLKILGKATGAAMEKLKAPRLDLLGVKVVSDIKNKIRSGIAPALKSETVARKGSSTPLINTGQLVNSVTHEVKKK